MRVLWMIDGLGHGGAENLMPALLKTLKNQVDDPRVCVLTVRAGNPIASELEKIGIPVDLIKVHNLRDFSNLWRLFQYIRCHHPDIIHTQLETSDILGTFYGKLLGIPSVSTMHTLDVQSKKIKEYVRNWLRWKCLNLISRRIIVVSEFTRQHYIGLGFKSSKLLTLYNGIDLCSFTQDGTNSPSKTDLFGVPGDSVVVTTVAVLREQKGIQYMLHAIKALVAQVPNLYYVIVGDGGHRESLEYMAKSLGIADHVVFMGHRTDIPQILAASDLFAYPSIKDALPTVLLEAMAAGVPIVASQIDGIPEIVENEVSGLLVPPANPSALTDGCLRVLCDSNLSNRLTAAAHSKIEQHFDIRIQANSILALYNQVVSNDEC